MVTPFPTARPASEIVDAFSAELDEIESIFGSCVGARTVLGFTIPYAPTEDGCLVSMWDAWNRFLRALTLNAAFGTFLGLSGMAYSPTVPRIEASAIAHLDTAKRGKAYRLIEGEPKWHNANHLADVMSTLDLHLNYSQNVVGAIGSNSVSLGPPVLEIHSKKSEYVEISLPTRRQQRWPALLSTHRAKWVRYQSIYAVDELASRRSRSGARLSAPLQQLLHSSRCAEPRRVGR